MTCLINLFVNAIVARSGKSVERHLERVSELFAHFTGFVAAGSGRGGRAAISSR
jgi:hypothetical protein